MYNFLVTDNNMPSNPNQIITAKYIQIRVNIMKSYEVWIIQISHVSGRSKIILAHLKCIFYS